MKNEAVKIIEQINALDFKTVTEKHLLDFILVLCKNAPIISLKIEKGTRIFRSVKGYVPSTISDLSYNPDQASSQLNRANWSGKSIFYAALPDLKNDVEPADISALEIMRSLDNGSNISSDTYYIGEWVFDQEAEFIVIGNQNSFKKISQIIENRLTRLDKFFNSQPDYRLQFTEIDDFISNQYCQLVSDEEKWRYKFSATYAEMLKRSGMKGLVYPSVQANGHGHNIAIYPEFVDNGTIRLLRAIEAKVYFRDNKCINEFLRQAIPRESELVWSNLKNHRLSDSIRLYYEGKAPDNTFIESFDYKDLND